MKDISFLKFYKNSLPDAVLNENASAWLTKYSGFVRMLPSETLFQITSLDETIAFAGNFKAELVNQCGDVLIDVTNRIFYREFTDENGIGQIKYEFGRFDVDYWEELIHLKLTNTASGDAWYSVAFCLTINRKEETALFKYRNVRDYAGVSYSRADVFQYIRLQCFKTDLAHEKESDEWKQLTGNKVNTRSIITRLYKYLFRYIDAFNYERLFLLLDHDVVYIDGQRMFNKPTPEKSDRTEDTNFFVGCSFLANLIDEYSPFQYQIQEYLKITSTTPINGKRYSLAQYQSATSAGTIYSFFFNKPITIDGTIDYRMYKDGVLFQQHDAGYFNVLGNELQIWVGDTPITENGVYSIILLPDKVQSDIDKWGGFVLNEFKFSIQTADFLDTDFNNNDFLT